MAARVPAVGKRVGGATYLHVSAIAATDEGTRRKVDRAASLADGQPWNVVKVTRDAVSLLLYEEFDEAAFPALLRSARVDLEDGTVSVTDYEKRANPPILHRKETLLPPNDPWRPAFAALTRLAEDHGLFKDSTRIGTRNAWRARLHAAGLEIHGYRLVPQAVEPVDVARHKTAITRRDLAQPMQLMTSHGVVASGRTVFDYGCGQGDDVAALAANGFEAFGWDPHHAPDGPRKAADVVNLGFVLNVIEDPLERVETLKAAWSFAGKAMSVAAMIAGKSPISGLRPYRDGYLTARGTFQKYYTQHELRDFIRDALGEAPIGLAPGIFAVFRDKDLEQEALLRRRSQRPGLPISLKAPERGRPTRGDRALRPVAARPGIAETLATELQEFWGLAVNLGRMPDADELPGDLLARFQAARVSAARAAEICLGRFDGKALEAAARTRREDLLVHFALTLFPGAPRYATLPRSIQRDVKAFLGSHAAAFADAKALLFSAGRPEAVRAGVDIALGAGLGGMRDDRTFRLHVPSLNRLPAVLRVLVGCAGVLQGGVEAADFVDIKLDGPRLSIITCDDAAKPLPVVVERVRVNLGRLKIRSERPEGLMLYLKSRYLPPDDPARERQSVFDSAVLATGLVDENGRGPPAHETAPLLAQVQGSGSVVRT